MNVTGSIPRHGHHAMRFLAWTIAIAAFLNVVFFTRWASDPVMRSDAWYFLDVFISKAIDGTLGLADFFVKRHGVDHAQPANKLVLYMTWRYFHLDFVFEALVGVFAAGVCMLLFHRFSVRAEGGQSVGLRRYVAWAAMGTVLFSMGTNMTWVWSLVTLEYVTFIPMLLFAWAVWTVWVSPSSMGYLLLAGATLLLGVVNDDSAWIVLLAVTMTCGVITLGDRTMRVRRAWKMFAVVMACMLMVRIGYVFAPVVGGAENPPLGSYLANLFVVGGHGAWWRWFAWPLLLSILPESPFRWLNGTTWFVVECVVVMLLLLAHGWFWRRALCGNGNLAKFAAVFLMFMTYGWVVGILIYRVSEYGNMYLYQHRYYSLYQFNLIALLMMWAASDDVVTRPGGRLRRAVAVTPYVGVLVLLAVQTLFAVQGWRARVYSQAYYRQMAVQLWELSKNPDSIDGCLAELVICNYPEPVRSRDIRLLHDHKLNVFSPEVQHWHRYLPRTSDAE